MRKRVPMTISWRSNEQKEAAERIAEMRNTSVSAEVQKLYGRLAKKAGIPFPDA